MSEQKPSVGRVVHYVSYGTPGGEYQSECRAAIVTGLCPADLGPDEGEPGPCVDAAVLNPTGLFFSQHLGYDEGRERTNDPSNLCTAREHRGGSWHWPARV